MNARILRLVSLVPTGFDPDLATGPFDWSDGGPGLITAVQGQRLTGALTAAVEAGAIVLDDHQEERLASAHLAALTWCLRLEERLCEVAETLEAAGVVDLLVVKGPAIAHVDDVDPARRTFGDLDLLVRGADVDRAVDALLTAGASRPYAERRPGFDRRFAKSVTLTFPDGIEIDLHRTICDGVHAVRLPIDRLSVDPTTFDLGGRTFATPGPTGRLLHAAYHAVLGSPTPRPMSRRDLLGYLRRTDGAVAPVADEAARWGGTAVLHAAVASVRALPGASLPGWSTWADATTIPEKERSIVAAQRRDGSSYGRSRLRVLIELDTWRDRLAYAGAVLVPSREHLATRGLTRGSLIRRATRR